MLRWLEDWTNFAIAIDELSDAGESVVADIRQHAEGQGSGTPAEIRFCEVWTFRGGKVIRREQFRDRADALKAVGASGTSVGGNVELAHRFYDSVNRRDLDALLSVSHEDAELVSILVSVEGGYHGHEGFRRWWEHSLGAFPDYTIDVGEVRDLGDATVAAIRLHGHGSGSGAPIDQDLWQVIEWRDGKAARVESFRSEADALDSVGQRE